MHGYKWPINCTRTRRLCTGGIATGAECCSASVTGGKNMEQQLLELGEEESVLEEQLAGGTLSAEEEAAIRARLAQISRMRKRLARSRMKSPAQELGYDAVQVRVRVHIIRNARI